MNAPAFDHRHATRREFLTEVGRGMLIASVGLETATGLGLASPAAVAAEPPALRFGALESLAALLEETPLARLIPVLADQVGRGTSLRQLVAAGARANARAFGGEDYVGFHTLMALAPALEMAAELPAPAQALPVFKVLHRNSARMHERSAPTAPTLAPVESGGESSGADRAVQLREAVRRGDLSAAEKVFAASSANGAEDALNDLLLTVEDETEVHRVVLPYRAWTLLSVTGPEHAHTLLRQSVRYCLRAESWKRVDSPDRARNLLPRVLEEHRLLDRSPGARVADDAWIEATSHGIFSSTPAHAAALAANALAEGMAPAALGEAITLAANQLILRDAGRSVREESAGKPVGSVHGDSIGVHACDSANAWRHLASVGRARHAFSCLILGAYQVALDRTSRGGDFLNWTPLPVARHVEGISATDPSTLLKDLDDAIRGNLQARAAALVHRYGALGHPARPVFDALLRYAISEDGSLHGEKFYRTVAEEFAATRAAFRWRHLVALARVTASEFGRTAAGIPEARAALGLGVSS